MPLVRNLAVEKVREIGTAVVVVTQIQTIGTVDPFESETVLKPSERNQVLGPVFMKGHKRRAEDVEIDHQ